MSEARATDPAAGPVPEALPPWWAIACRGAELVARPLARTVHGVPLVLLRGPDGTAGAMLDRCPHRNVALSGGRMVRGALQCPYHGWRFDAHGACVEVPGACERPAGRLDATAFPVREAQGFVWVGGTPGAPPPRAPFGFPHLGEPAWHTFVEPVSSVATLADAAENFLDGTHTHTVHAGLIRVEGRRRASTAEVVRWPDRVEVAYRDDDTISGLIHAVLGRGVRRLDVHARFILPGVAQLEYVTDGPKALVLSLALVPAEPGRLAGWLVATFRGVPGWLGRLAARPLFVHAARQDAAILAAQSAGIARFGGPRYTYTELDLVRPHVDVLLRRLHAEGLPAPAEPGAEPEARRTQRLWL